MQVFNYSTIFLTSNGVDAATVVIISVLMNVGNVAITVVSVRLMDLSGRRSLMLRCPSPRDTSTRRRIAHHHVRRKGRRVKVPQAN